MSEVELLRESLRKALQERDYYRSETARLRTENAKLQNDIDALFAQLSDLDGLRRMKEVSAELNAGNNRNPVANAVVKADPDEPNPIVIDLCSEDEQSSPAVVTAKSLKRPRPGSTVGEARNDVKRSRMEPAQTNGAGVDNRQSGSMTVQGARTNAQAGPHTISRPRQTTPLVKTGVLEDQVMVSDGESAADKVKPLVRDENQRTRASCSVEDLVAFHFSNKVSTKCFTLSIERTEEYLRNVSFSFLPPPRPSVIVSRHFLAQNAVSNRGGVARLKYTLKTGSSSTRHIITGREAPYFPVKFGSPGLFLSCDRELLEDGSRMWSCFAQKSRKLVRYIGEYRLRCIDEMTPAEFKAQKIKAQKRHAKLLNSRKLSKKDRLARLPSRPPLRILYGLMLTKISIFLMKYVEYDDEFAHSLRATSDRWGIAEGEEKRKNKPQRAGKKNQRARSVTKTRRTSSLVMGRDEDEEADGDEDVGTDEEDEDEDSGDEDEDSGDEDEDSGDEDEGSGDEDDECSADSKMSSDSDSEEDSEEE
ncbi:hypothetical protein BU15DRAFT_62407 [Melanogaster broomeanus]|nr:hypothetical protein BU15DRAFT_62407 [Melanogaster broomeanus]